MGRTIVWKTIGSQVFTLSQDVKDFQNNGNLLECTKGVKLEFASRVQTPFTLLACKTSVGCNKTNSIRLIRSFPAPKLILIDWPNYFLNDMPILICFKGCPAA